MSAIADSDAVFDASRMLPQHQAALTLLQNKLSDPQVGQFRWLDLASGKGQIIAHLEKNLNKSSRSKLVFTGFDVDNHHTRSARRIAESMELAACEFTIGELRHFHHSESTSGPWDFISLTNTVHEISPHSLASILVNAIERLGPSGCFFVYDMDRLSTPELGAVLWTGPEFCEILIELCRSLGCVGYEPSVAVYPHRTCNGWNAQVNKAHMGLPNDWRDNINASIVSTETCIVTLLNRKLESTRRVLEALTMCGPGTGEEAEDKTNRLFDYWAITRALEQK